MKFSRGRRIAGDDAGDAAFLNATLPKSRQTGRPVHHRFIALVKPPFKSSDDYPLISRHQITGEHAKADRSKASDS
jgi:hypothetical protein